MIKNELKTFTPYMLKDPTFFKNLFNLPVSDVHPIIVFKDEINYFFMTLSTFKEKHEMQIKSFGKIKIKGQGAQYHLTRDSILHSDVIYKVDKKLLNKNVFGENKKMVKILKDIEIQKILKDMTHRLTQDPPRIALAVLDVDQYNRTHSKFIYSDKKTFEQYRNAAEKDRNYNPETERIINDLSDYKQISDELVINPVLEKVEIEEEIKLLKNVLYDELKLSIERKRSIIVKDEEIEKLKEEVKLVRSLTMGGPKR
ncbi:Mbov_0400 family ICE element protein [Mycoplasmopsis agassizii]|nr:hypothetical protein [Mycoplasmopsis agassizii]SMC18619.1 hypothetical protein SAMN02745179_00727 [Mycoplasmopsis agassizii]